MADRKTYNSVSDMVQEASGNDGFAAAYERRLADRRVIKDLMIKRAMSGLSQKDIARSFGCTQSRISKLENMTDGELTLGDLAKYSGALGLHLRITLGPEESKPVARNGYVSFEICGNGAPGVETCKTKSIDALRAPSFRCSRNDVCRMTAVVQCGHDRRITAIAKLERHIRALVATSGTASWMGRKPLS